MTPDEERLCRSYHRSVFDKWTNGEYTFEQAVYITKYCEFCWTLRLRHWPAGLVAIAGWFYHYVLFIRWYIRDSP